MKNMIILTTDGSSLIKKNKYEASSACCIHINDKFVCDFGVYHKNGTNSLGELYAIVLGLDRLSEIINDNPELKYSDIIVLSDSDYVIKSLNSYIFSWVKQGMDNVWKTSKNEDVSYQSLFKYIWNEYHGSNGYYIGEIKVNFYHMRGHIGEKISKSVAYNKFIKKSKLNISIDIFDKFISYNHHVDELANMIRLKKCIYYEEKGDDNKWVKNTKAINTKNGRIVILPRSRERN